MGRQENLWNSKEYVDYRYKLYESFKQYLGVPPKTLLDIGCGFAHEAGWFNTEHGTDIWLMDKNRKDENHDDKGTTILGLPITLNLTTVSPLSDLV